MYVCGFLFLGYVNLYSQKHATKGIGTLQRLTFTIFNPVSLCGYVHVSVCAPESQKKAMNILELELRAAVNPDPHKKFLESNGSSLELLLTAKPSLQHSHFDSINVTYSFTNTVTERSIRTNRMSLWYQHWAPVLACLPSLRR